MKAQIARVEKLAKRVLDRVTVRLLLTFAGECQAEPSSRTN